MGTHCSTHCGRSVELDNTRIVNNMCDARRNDPIHLRHDLGDYQLCRPHKGHELGRRGGNKQPGGLNVRMHAGRLGLQAKGCI